MIVFLFLIDGLGYEYVPKEFKNHCQKIQNQIPTITAPNWISILTGLPVKKHKVINNEIVSRKKPENFVSWDSTILDDEWKNSWIFSDWKPFHKIFPEQKNFFYLKKKMFFDNIKNKLLLLGKTKPDFVLVNTEQMDWLGHTHGWESLSVKKRIKKIFHEINELFYFVLDNIDNDPVFFYTADHGGHKKDHEDHNNKKIRNVPFGYISFQTFDLSKIKKTTDIRDWLKQQPFLHS